MVTRISDLTATHPNLWLVEVLITRLQAQNTLTDAAANRIKGMVYQAIHAGEIKSHDATTTLQIRDPGEYTPLITAESFSNWLVANGSTLRFKKPKRKVTAPKNVPQRSTNWKNLIQIEAGRKLRALRAAGANPTVSSILNDMATWCRENNIKTTNGIFPSPNYLRTHVLGGKHWTRP
jgi:hypothetical protein